MLECSQVQSGLFDFFTVNFPNYTQLTIEKLEKITNGWETEIFSFKFSYQEKGKSQEKDLIIRIYPCKNTSQKQEKELSIYPKLLKAKYPVPKIHYHSTNRNFIGKPFIIMDRIKGKILVEFTDSCSYESVEVFSSLFVNLHKLDWKLFVKEEQHETAPTSSIDKFIDNMRRRISKFNLYELTPIIEWLDEEKKEIKKEILALNHHDFHHYNILLDTNNEPYVIDWGGAAVRDFRFDLGWTLVLVNSYMTRELRDAIFNTYQEKTGKAIENISFFEVFGILRRLTDVLSTLKFGPEALGMHDSVIPIILEHSYSIYKALSYLKELTGIKIPEVELVIEKTKKRELMNLINKSEERNV